MKGKHMMNDANNCLFGYRYALGSCDTDSDIDPNAFHKSLDDLYMSRDKVYVLCYIYMYIYINSIIDI